MIENPNFWSSWAVAMYSWVWASTPAVTRTITGHAATPVSAVICSSRSISWNESTMIRPTPRTTARRSSANDLLLPWNPIRDGSTPARSATVSSPPVQTSSASPSSATQRATVVQRKAFPA